jgi:hypothetical protein
VENVQEYYFCMTCAGRLATPAETTAEVIMPFADLSDVKKKAPAVWRELLILIESMEKV